MCARKSCDDINQKMFDFAMKAITVLQTQQTKNCTQLNNAMNS